MERETEGKREREREKEGKKKRKKGEREGKRKKERKEGGGKEKEGVKKTEVRDLTRHLSLSTYVPVRGRCSPPFHCPPQHRT